jgi:hypothetical protein
MWEPPTVKQELLNRRSPWQLQRPLGRAPPSDKHIKMRSSSTAASVMVTLMSVKQLHLVVYINSVATCFNNIGHHQAKTHLC